MKEYIGMNFQKWCGLEEDDERKMYIDFNGKHYTSEQEITLLELMKLTEATIKDIDLINNEWHIILK